MPAQKSKKSIKWQVGMTCHVQMHDGLHRVRIIEVKSHIVIFEKCSDDGKPLNGRYMTSRNHFLEKCVLQDKDIDRNKT